MILKIGDIITLKPHGLGSGGEGVGYYEGYVVFVDGALPGEVISARMIDCKKRHGWAELVEILEPSVDRVKPPCVFYEKCGGCQWMHLSYEKQLDVKRQKVIDAMQRIGKFENCPVASCKPSPQSFRYRNKIQLPVREGKEGLALGLYARSSHDLIEVDHCLIHCEIGQEAYQVISKILKSSNIVPYNPATGQGELRHLLIKSGVNTQEVMVVVVTNQAPSTTLIGIAEHIMAKVPFIKGVVHNRQAEASNVVLGSAYQVLCGSGHITEHLGHLSFKVSPASFFQVNPAQAERLYSQALQGAKLTGDEIVLDAYCGVGTLSLFFAGHAKEVIGVESVAEAINDAKYNAGLNGIKNTTFVCAPAEKYIETLNAVDVILLNPPRKGCELAFLQGIKRLAPEKILYISCDPATLARDLAYLRDFGYLVEGIQPFDMFPQTTHVECIAFMRRL
jgi:23S rRNA (uracil1939-C5)-methyltransferase